MRLMRFYAFLCGFKTNPLKLLMYIDNEVIESLEIEREKIVFPGYLSYRVRRLKEKYNSRIDVDAEAEFLIQDISCITTPFEDGSTGSR